MYQVWLHDVVAQATEVTILKYLKASSKILMIDFVSVLLHIIKQLNCNTCCWHQNRLNHMKRLFFVVILLISLSSAFAKSDYYIKKAQSYQREAEYYQKKADGYRREAAYNLKKAEGYQHVAAYYTKRGDLDRAKTYSRYAENEMDKYETQLRYAAQANDKAAMYLRWAADALKKQ